MSEAVTMSTDEVTAQEDTIATTPEEEPGLIVHIEVVVIPAPDPDPEP